MPRTNILMSLILMRTDAAAATITMTNMDIIERIYKVRDAQWKKTKK